MPAPHLAAVGLRSRAGPPVGGCPSQQEALFLSHQTQKEKALGDVGCIKRSTLGLGLCLINKLEQEK